MRHVSRKKTASHHGPPRHVRHVPRKKTASHHGPRRHVRHVSRKKTTSHHGRPHHVRHVSRKKTASHHGPPWRASPRHACRNYSCVTSSPPPAGKNCFSPSPFGGGDGGPSFAKTKSRASRGKQIASVLFTKSTSQKEPPKVIPLSNSRRDGDGMGVDGVHRWGWKNIVWNKIIQ